jgi:hypothetical protein
MQAAADAATAAAASGGNAQQQAAWQDVFGRPATAAKPGSRQQPAKGSGKGGAGANKVCVPCTIKKMQQLIAEGQLPREQLLTADAARAFQGFVQATHAHTKRGGECPYCKCKDCARAFQKRGSLDPATFTLDKNCQGGKKK